MLTTVMFIYMVLRTVIRLLAEAILVPLQITDLPLTVLLVTGAIILYGVFLILLRLIKKENKLWSLVCFYGLDIVAVLFNLFFIAFFVPTQVGGWDVLITGTLIDVLINLFLIIAAVIYARHQRYVKIKENFQNNSNNKK